MTYLLFLVRLLLFTVGCGLFVCMLLFFYAGFVLSSPATGKPQELDADAVARKD